MPNLKNTLFGAVSLITVGCGSPGNDELGERKSFEPAPAKTNEENETTCKSITAQFSQKIDEVLKLAGAIVHDSQASVDYYLPNTQNEMLRVGNKIASCSYEFAHPVLGNFYGCVHSTESEKGILDNYIQSVVLQEEGTSQELSVENNILGTGYISGFTLKIQDGSCTVQGISTDSSLGGTYCVQDCQDLYDFAKTWVTALSDDQRKLFPPGL